MTNIIADFLHAYASSSPSLSATEGREVSVEEAEALAREWSDASVDSYYRVPYIECSAKTGEAVRDAYILALRSALRYTHHWSIPVKVKSAGVEAITAAGPHASDSKCAVA